MSIISVDAKELGLELSAWRVPKIYAMAFAKKNGISNGRVALHPFFFNDTEHLDSSRHWLAVNAAFWCCVYRQAESKEAQGEALASIRAMFYLAGSLGIGEIKALLQEWWRNSFPLHQIPAPNFSTAVKQPTFH